MENQTKIGFYDAITGKKGCTLQFECEIKPGTEEYFAALHEVKKAFRKKFSLEPGDTLDLIEINWTKETMQILKIKF